MQRTKNEPGQVVPLPTRQRTLWTVVLEVQGHAWAHRWYGYAANSEDATTEARRDFYGTLFDDAATVARYPVRVRSCTQVKADE